MSENDENRQAGQVYRAQMPMVASGNSENQNPDQLRQPHNIQGLLRFAMEATKAEDAPSASQFSTMDEERKQFLERALKTMTYDAIEKLENSIKILQKADKLTSNSDIFDQIDAFETILQHIDMIDTAIDFQKIGGFSIIQPCLMSPNPKIRALACSVVAECTQNNPFCQATVVESDLLEHILSLLDRDNDASVQKNALYAISCTIRENKKATDKFVQLSGLKIVLKVMKNGCERCKSKAAFLLGRLAASEESIREQLIHLEIIPVICQLISDSSHNAHEHLLSLLSELVKNSVAVDICTEPELQLKNILKTHVKKCDGRKDLIEQVEYCKNLLKILENIEPNFEETDR